MGRRGDRACGGRSRIGSATPRTSPPNRYRSAGPRSLRASSRWHSRRRSVRPCSCRSRRRWGCDALRASAAPPHAQRRGRRRRPAQGPHGAGWPSFAHPPARRRQGTRTSGRPSQQRECKSTFGACSGVCANEPRGRPPTVPRTVLPTSPRLSARRYCWRGCRPAAPCGACRRSAAAPRGREGRRPSHSTARP